MHRVEPKPRILPILVAAAAVTAIVPAAEAAWIFTNVTPGAGVNVLHDVDTLGTVAKEQVAGAACADYNGDGWLDLYFLGGNASHNYLFRNNGNGTFSDVAAAMGVDAPGSLGCGACFADWDGDGDPDLFVGGIEATDPKLYRNDGGSFTDVTTASGVVMTADTYSASFGDVNGDDWLDLFVSHWGTSPQGTGHIWLNDGDGTFTNADAAVGYTGFPPPGGDNTFAYNLADLDSDGDLDFVCASDFLTSHVYRNDGGTFANITNAGVIIDDNGMGCATGDYDNDGDIDWFVSSIYNFPFKVGNRLYRNNGSGVFTDATSTAAVDNGSWAWGSTMQDFDNDGWLDIYHVNGWRNGFSSAPSRLFRNNHNATFSSIAATVGANHAGEGRGVVAFDYDRDGDLDLFLANNDQQATLLRNDGLTGANWLQVTLTGPPPNIQQIGARVKVTIGATTQMREIRCGNNFVSQDPVAAHFGLGAAATVNTLRVEWTDGTVTQQTNVAANQAVNVSYPGVDAPVVHPPVRGGITLLGAAPNPFRSGTLIRFSLDRAAETLVRVYDATGRAVRTLSEGSLAEGHQVLSWDGRDDAGQPVSSGVYWYKVSTPDHSARGKVILVR
jgi:hypothetical protein